MRDCYISPEYETVVKLHIYGNMLVQDSDYPLIMGIFGPTGEGKTFQLEKILNELKIGIIDISSGELENENSGYPAQLLRTEYIAASNANCPTALVINDIDAILGKWGDLTQYTVNRQNVSVQLMHFCDNPYDVAGQKTRRVPIFLTGNNPSILYEPLTRPGRMRIFEWQPKDDIKVEIVSKIFNNINYSDIKSLVLKNKGKPISFWSDLYSIIWEKRFLATIETEYSPRQIHQMLLRKEKLELSPITVSLAELQNELESRGEDLSSKNYLQKMNYPGVESN